MHSVSLITWTNIVLRTPVRVLGKIHKSAGQWCISGHVETQKPHDVLSCSSGFWVVVFSSMVVCVWFGWGGVILVSSHCKTVAAAAEISIFWTFWHHSMGNSVIFNFIILLFEVQHTKKDNEIELSKNFFDNLKKKSPIALYFSWNIMRARRIKGCKD